MTDRYDDHGFDWALLARYFSGETTEAERRELELWIAAAPERQQEVAALRKLWQEAGRLPTAARVDALWSSVSRQMHAAEGEGQPPLHLAPRAGAAGAERGAHRVARRRMPVAIAASLVLALGASALWWARDAAGPRSGEAPRTFQTGRGQTAHVRLVDGSEVQLGPESRLQVYPTGAEIRAVELVGEAVFKVEHDEARPFLVHSGGAVTEDLGTEFGIRAYPGDHEVRVVVVEGRVSVRPRSAPAHSGTILLPGQLGRVDSGGRVAVENGADKNVYLAWARARLVFQQTPLRDVAVELGRRYDVRIQIADSSVASQRITLDIPAGSISEVLDAVAVPLSLRYERSGGLIRLHR